MHYCIRCGGPCDCWAYDQSRGEVCDGCSDCARPEEPEDDIEPGSGDFPIRVMGRGDLYNKS